MTPIPNAALDDRLAFVGTAGSGKTYSAGTAVERLLKRKARVVVIDPLGAWYGLRLKPDGKTPSGFDVVIFGGPRGDIAITEHAGAAIGEAVASMAESCIIDLSQIGTKAGERRFMLAFLTALYRRTNGEPLTLVIDEADMFAPQRILDKEGDAAKLLGMMETVCRRGRIKGFIPWLITQRPAVLSKDVLSQADGLIAFKLTSVQDRDAIGDWVQGQADRSEWRKMFGELAKMQKGQGVIWLPARSILRIEQFPAKETFDSSRTPSRGETRHAAELKPLDLGALRGRLASIEADAKANDPKALRTEITALKAEKLKLERQVATAAPAVDPAAIAGAEHRGYQQGMQRGLAEASAAYSAFCKHIAEIATAVEIASNDTLSRSDTLKRMQITTGSAAPLNSHATAAPVRPAPPTRPRQTCTADATRLPPGEAAVLIAAAQFNGVEREQLTILTGYKRSSRDAYIQRLREKGFVVVSGSTVTLTPAGAAALPPDYEPLPTGRDLQAYWLGRLPEGERKVLQVLIDAYPRSVPRPEIDAATGYQRSSRDAYLQRMKVKRLWEPDGSAVRASEALFG